MRNILELSLYLGEKKKYCLCFLAIFCLIFIFIPNINKKVMSLLIRINRKRYKLSFDISFIIFDKDLPEILSFKVDWPPKIDDFDQKLW